VSHGALLDGEDKWDEWDTWDERDSKKPPFCAEQKWDRKEKNAVMALGHPKPPVREDRENAEGGPRRQIPF
jgi:hypothetical protein